VKYPYLLIVLFAALLSLLLLAFGYRFSRQRTDIDYLLALTQDIKNQGITTDTVYFIREADNDNSELHFKTQFAWAPGLVIPAEYTQVPAGKVILMVEPALPEQPPTDSILQEEGLELLYKGQNEMFSVKALRKVK
jgi:hypothetical protein